MLNTNPFAILAETVSPLAMQGFIIAMIVLIAAGTIIQMISHRNLTYFFDNMTNILITTNPRTPIKIENIKLGTRSPPIPVVQPMKNTAKVTIIP